MYKVFKTLSPSNYIYSATPTHPPKKNFGAPQKINKIKSILKYQEKYCDILYFITGITIGNILHYSKCADI